MECYAKPSPARPDTTRSNAPARRPQRSARATDAAGPPPSEENAEDFVEHFFVRMSTNWATGARMMAVNLDFRDANELVEWAVKHPQVWGNHDGMSLFSSEGAYEAPWGDANRAGYHALTVRDVANHWDGVAQRLGTLEAGKTPAAQRPG